MDPSEFSPELYIFYYKLVPKLEVSESFAAFYKVGQMLRRILRKEAGYVHS